MFQAMHNAFTNLSMPPGKQVFKFCNGETMVQGNAVHAEIIVFFGDDKAEDFANFNV